MRVLIVDDSRAMRSILTKLFTEIGFEVTTANGGPEGLQSLKNNSRPDVMLVDWNMPEMNGCEVVKAVRSDPANDSVCILMCTTETDTEYVSQAIEAGANEYIMKPFTADVVREKLSIVGITAQ